MFLSMKKMNQLLELNSKSIRIYILLIVFICSCDVALQEVETPLESA